MKSSLVPKSPDKRYHYRTAYATISCAVFKKGDCVSVEYTGPNWQGTHFYNIKKSQHGDLPYVVAYPEHHLERFVF